MPRIPTNNIVTSAIAAVITNPAGLESIESFWKAYDSKQTKKPTQYERYCEKNAPECIRRFIQIGGGPKMGTTLEDYARHRFPCLQKRSKGKHQTGYDHNLPITIPQPANVMIEQKSSGHWGEDDYKWQHIEDKHPWHMLLLCGIDYHSVHFWGMDRPTFHQLRTEGKITNQGNSTGESSEGVWFNYSDVKDSLIEFTSCQDLTTFAQRAFQAAAPIASE
jgi:hypothetical protein